MNSLVFLPVAEDLEIAGLLWRPEIGDEVWNRSRKDMVSILVDPQGMSPSELRSTFLWLPTVEQMVSQFEARRAILFHVGLELSESCLCYKTVLNTAFGPIETKADNMRNAIGIALRDLLLNNHQETVN